LVPGLGDLVNVFLNYWLIAREAQKAEYVLSALFHKMGCVLNIIRGPRLPEWLEKQMLFNQVFAFLCGTVPLLGDIVVAIFACNARNVALFEEYLAVRGAEYLKPEGDRRYDPADIKPGAGMESGESPVLKPTTASPDPDHQPLAGPKAEV
jgi:hypothetical protein